MIFNIFLSILLLLISPVSEGSEDSEGKGDRFRFKGTFYSRVVGDYYRNSKYEHFGEWRNKLFLSIDSRPWRKVNLHTSVKIDYSLLISEREERTDLSFDLFELYAHYEGKKFDIYAGKQTVTWGVGDVSILDIVNPRDISEGAYLESDFIKIPIISFRFIYYFSDMSEGEFLFIPFYEPNRFSFIGTDWSIISNEILQKNERIDELNAIDRLLSGAINPFLKDYPEKDFLHPETGVRFTMRMTDFDATFVIFAGYTDFPYPHFNPDYVKRVQQTSGDLTTEEKIFSITPMDMITYSKPFDDVDFVTLRPDFFLSTGAGISSDIKGYGIRVEFLLSYPNYFIGENLGVVKKLTLAFGGGIDKTFLDNRVYLNLIYNLMYVNDFDQDLFLTERFNSAVGGMARVKIVEEKLSADAGGTYDITFKDFILFFQLTYSFSDSFQLSGGTRILHGREVTPFGYFEENSGFYIMIKYIL